MDEQAETPSSGRGEAGDDDVTTIDLAPSSTGGSGRAAPSWLGRVALGVLAVALVAGGVVLARDDGSGGGDDLDPLAIGGLGGSNEMGVAAADMAYPWGGYEYQLAVDLPDLGSGAPVYQLVRPDLGADHWTEMAAAFGIAAPATAGADGSFVADDGSRRLDVYPVPGAWSVNVGESYDETMIEPASSGGGTAGSAGVATDAGSADAAAREDVLVEVIDEETGTTHTVPASPEAVIAEEATEALTEPEPVPAEDLPSQEEAEAAARGLLDEAGVLEGGEWDVEVIEGGMSTYAVSCAQSEDAGIAEVCVSEPATVQVESWSVVFHRVVDGVVTSGLAWSVDIGAGDRVSYVYGAVTELEPLGDYPLRTTQAAYDELLSQGDVSVGNDVGVPEPMPATDVPVAPPSDSADGGVDQMDPPVTGYFPDDPVRLRPESCASGIEPGYCVPGWCLDNAGDPMCEEPCTADSLECGPAGRPVPDVCNGEPDSTCTQVDPDLPWLVCHLRIEQPCQPVAECSAAPSTMCVPNELPSSECVPGPAVDCALVDPVPETTIPVCNDTVEAPSTDGAPVPDVAPACIDPGITCADAPPDSVDDGGAVGVAPECVGPPTTEPFPPDTQPMPEPEPTVITVTGVELTATITWGVADGVEVQYLVPAYRFSGTFPDGSPWSTELVAVSDDLVVPPGEVDPPVTVTTLPPPSTSIPEPTCSNETPEACGGSMPTTVPTPIDDPCAPNPNGVVPPSCPPVTTIPGEPVTTIPVTTVVDDLQSGTTAGPIE